MDMVITLKKHGINSLVYAEELKYEGFLDAARECGIDCISALDTRSAVYLATGICAQNKAPVAVFVDSGSSRSAFSGMTEAFYRKLPVILFTLGKTMDYSVELRDVVLSHHVVSAESGDWESILNGEFPMHIELPDYPCRTNRLCSDRLREVFRSVLDGNKYLYVGQDIQLDGNAFECKVVHGGLANSSDGALSNVLGASLARIRNRYIGLVSENEFLHDMNCLGNVNVSDSLLFIVVTERENPVIGNYAKSLGFETAGTRLNELDEDDLRVVVSNGKKTVVTLYKE